MGQGALRKKREDLSGQEEASILLASKDLQSRGVIPRLKDPVQEMLNNPNSQFAQVVATNVMASQMDEIIEEKIFKLQMMKDMLRAEMREAAREMHSEGRSMEMHDIKMDGELASLPENDPLNERAKELETQINGMQNELNDIQSQLADQKAQAENINTEANQQLNEKASTRVEAVINKIKEDLPDAAKTSEETNQQLIQFMRKNESGKDPARMAAESRVRAELEAKGQEYDPANPEHKNLVQEQYEAMDQKAIQAKALNVTAIDLAAALQSGPRPTFDVKQEEKEKLEAPDGTKDDDARKDLDRQQQKITPNMLMAAAKKLKSTTVETAHDQRQEFRGQDFQEIDAARQQKMEQVDNNIEALNKRLDNTQDKLNHLKDQRQDFQNDLREVRKDAADLRQDQREERMEDKAEQQAALDRQSGPGPSR